MSWRCTARMSMRNWRLFCLISGINMIQPQFVNTLIYEVATLTSIRAGEAVVSISLSAKEIESSKRLLRDLSDL